MEENPQLSRMLVWLASAFCVAWLACLPRMARPAALPELCEAAAQVAAERTGVPVTVLSAISLTETGRRIGARTRPWPWTVNMEGKGKWFDSRAEALDYVRRNHARGARSYDVGCFQTGT